MSLLTWIYGDDENAQRGIEADAEIRRLARETYGADYVLQEDRTRGQEGVEGYINTIQAQEEAVTGAFGEGLDDGASNVTGFISKTFGFVGKALSSVLLGIPFWVWLLAATAVFGWLGGFPWLLKKSKGVLK